VSYKTFFCSDLTLFGNDQTFFCSVQIFFPSDQTFFCSDQTFFSAEQTFFCFDETFFSTEQTFFSAEQTFFSTEQTFFSTEQTFFSTETSCSNCIIFVNRSILIVTCSGTDRRNNYYFPPFNLFATCHDGRQRFGSVSTFFLIFTILFAIFSISVPWKELYFEQKALMFIVVRCLLDEYFAQFTVKISSPC
jgi:hypothetical protein